MYKSGASNFENIEYIRKNIDSNIKVTIGEHIRKNIDLTKITIGNQK